MKSWLILTALVVGTALTGCSGGGATGCGSGVTPIGGGASSASGGCGGGGSGQTLTPAVTVAIAPSQITTSSAGTATAHVTDNTGAGASGIVVTFTNDATIGKLSSATALTDGSGNATITITPASGTAAGADTLTATATVAGASYSGSAGYAVAVSPATFKSFTTDLGSAPLAAYSRTTLSIAMDNVSTTNPVTLNLSSDCLTAGKATITPTTVTNSTGVMSFTYVDTGGCGALLSSDHVLATVAGGTGLTSTLTLPLTAPAASSLAFKTAVPATIYLKGSGLQESSTVTFTVVDLANNPLPNQHVMVGLTSFTGGLTLDGGTAPVAKTSDSSGVVSVLVNSGTVPTPVRVRAVLGDDFNAAGGTVSSGLAVATGLPSEANFSLSQEAINIEGAQVEGNQDVLTIHAADRSGNPVPDGTAITFWSEGGQVVAQALTSTIPAVNGGEAGIAVAHANFVSADFRPADGHVTVLAYALGEETFVDQNGNNVWDAGEPFQDLGDVDKDVLFDGVYDKNGGDSFVSLTGSVPGGTQACVDNGSINELLADTPAIPMVQTTCDGTWSNKVYVRKATEIIFSASTANPTWYDNSALDGAAYYDALTGKAVCPTVILQSGSSASSATRFFDVFSNPTWTAPGGSGTVFMRLNDTNPVRLNPMPVNTTVTVTPGDSAVMTVGPVLGAPVANMPFPGAISFTYALQGTNTSGTATVNITTAGPRLANGATAAKVTTSVTINIIKGTIVHACQTN